MWKPKNKLKVKCIIHLYLKCQYTCLQKYIYIQKCPKVHIYPKVTRITCVSTTIQDYPSHMYMYPKLSKPHVHVSEMSIYMYPKLSKPHVHVSKCTYPIRHIKTQASSCSFSRLIV